MHAAIKEVIERHVMAYHPRGEKCVTYSGVGKVADELGVTYDAADELIRSWIRETF